MVACYLKKFVNDTTKISDTNKLKDFLADVVCLFVCFLFGN